MPGLINEYDTTNQLESRMIRTEREREREEKKERDNFRIQFLFRIFIQKNIIYTLFVRVCLCS